jgi:hypothetical protein
VQFFMPLVALLLSACARWDRDLPLPATEVRLNAYEIPDHHHSAWIGFMIGTRAGDIGLNSPWPIPKL